MASYEAICMFSRWPPNHTESYIAVDSLLMYLGIFAVVLCWSLFYNASLCVLSIFVNTLTRKRMIVALL